jgi:hypothetical protein
MKYAYENLSPTQFETLIILLCQRLLGISVQGFAIGPDGGKDARFDGTAELFPSKSAPWIGGVVIQAKHTIGYNKNFYESDFFSKTSDKNTLGEELPRIEKLRTDKELDHYMLFANRRLAGKAEQEIRVHISTRAKIPQSSVYLAGLEQLELWWKQFPDVPDLAELDPLDCPLTVSPDQLADVVQALADEKETIIKIVDDPPLPRVSYEAKNVINGMTPDYAAAQRRKYLKETKQIGAFLSDPDNSKLRLLYDSVADEFQLKIVSKRKEYHSFDLVMEYLAELLFGRDVILSQNRRLTRLVLFFGGTRVSSARGDTIVICGELLASRRHYCAARPASVFLCHSFHRPKVLSCSSSFVSRSSFSISARVWRGALHSYHQ